MNVDMQRDSFPSLREALVARDLSRETAHVPFGCAADAAAMASRGGASAYWLLRSLASEDWMRRLRHVLGRLIRSGETKALWALGDMLSAVGAADPEAVVGSGLIEELLQVRERPAQIAAVNAIFATDAWDTDPIRSELSTAPVDLDPGLFQYVVGAITEWAETSPDGFGVALYYFDIWLSVDVPDEQAQKVVNTRISRALSDLVERQEEAVLERAVAIISLDARAGSGRSIESALQFAASPDRLDERAAIRVRNLLIDALRDGIRTANTIQDLEELITSDSISERMIALDVAKEAPTSTGSVLVLALEDPENLAYPLGKWTRYLLHEAFSTLTAEHRADVESALLGMPDQVQDEAEGLLKYLALKAIPADPPSDVVQREIERILQINASLEDLHCEVERPGEHPAPFAYFVQEGPPAPEVGEKLDDPAALLPWLHTQLIEGQDQWTDPLQSHVERGLKEKPSRIEPLATAMAAEEDRLPTWYFIAVASAVRAKADDLDGDTIVRIAEALDVVRDSTIRDEMAPSLGSRWQDMSDSAQATALELLCSWADPETEPQPTVEETERALSEQPDAVQFGLNTARGAAAMALVDILRQSGENEAPPGVPETLMALTRDPSVGVRAVLAWYLRNIVHLPHLRDWRIEAAKSLLHDFHPLVMPLTHLLLRDLTQSQIEEFGASVVRVMLGSGNQPAEAGGFLAAIWHLRHRHALGEQLVHEVLHGDSPEARAEAAHVFAYNLTDEAPSVVSECLLGCRQLLVDEDPRVRRALATNIEFGDNPGEDVLALLRRLGEDSDTEVLGQLDTKLLQEVSDRDAPRAPVIAAIVQGIVTNECEEAQLEFIRSISHRLKKVLEILSETGSQELALRLLDRCCYHCIPAAAPLLDALELGDLD